MLQSRLLVLGDQNDAEDHDGEEEKDLGAVERAGCDEGHSGGGHQKSPDEPPPPLSPPPPEKEKLSLELGAEVLSEKNDGQTA